MKSIMITLYVVFNLVVTMCLATMNNPPVIDISPLIHPSLSTEEERKQVQEEIFKASNTWGFFQVLNHGISSELQENLLSQMKLFFHSSQDIKYTIKRTEYNSRGFADDELTKRLKDVKELVDIGQEPYTDLSPQAMLNQALDGYNQWPNEKEYIHLSNFKTIMNQYYSECLILSQILIQALASSIPCANSNYFIKEFQQHSSFLRLNYYPVLINATDAGAETMIPTPNPIDPMARTEELPRRLGVSRHTDAGALTVLLQDPNPAVTSGLEVLYAIYYLLYILLQLYFTILYTTTTILYYTIHYYHYTLLYYIYYYHHYLYYTIHYYHYTLLYYIYYYHHYTILYTTSDILLPLYYTICTISVFFLSISYSLCIRLYM